MLTEPQVFAFGPCCLDLRTEQLLRDGQAVHLAPKCYEILRYLVDHSDRLVPKEELLEAVWPDTNVELAALTVAIGRIRQALGDDPRAPRFIETVHRRGYRFIADVAAVTDSQSQRAPAGFEPGASTEPTRSVPTLRWRWALRLGSAAVVAIAVLLFGDFRSIHPPATPGRLLPHRLTTTGNIVKAAITADGKRIAYVNLEAGREGLRIRDLDGGNDTELLAPAERHFLGVMFSPQGDALLCSIQQDPAPAASLYHVSLRGSHEPRDLGVQVDSGVAFSSDGRRIVYMRDNAKEERSELWLAAPDGTGETLLASRKVPEYFDYPAWSPDDSLIACTLVNRERERVGVALIETSTGVVRTLARDAWLFARNVFWSEAGRSLLVTGRLPEEPAYQVWSVSPGSGEVRSLTGTDSSLSRVAVARQAETIISVESRSTSRVLIADSTPSGEQRPGARWRALPQGQRPAAGSSHVGWTAEGWVIVEAAGNLYLAGLDGQAERIAAEGISGHPVSCGSYIVYTTALEDRSEIRAYDTASGLSRTLVRSPGFAGPHCAPQSEYLVYSEVQRGGWSGLFKMPLRGGAAVQLSGGDTYLPAVSHDGSRIAAFWSDPAEVRQTRQTALAVLSFDGTPLARFPLPPTADHTKGPRWTPDGRAVAYIDLRDGGANLWAQPVDGGPARRLTHLQTTRIFSFAWTPAGDRLAVAVGEQPSDLVLLSAAESTNDVFVRR